MRESYSALLGSASCRWRLPLFVLPPPPVHACCFLLLARSLASIAQHSKAQHSVILPRVRPMQHRQALSARPSIEDSSVRGHLRGREGPRRSPGRCLRVTA